MIEMNAKFFISLVFFVSIFMFILTGTSFSQEIKTLEDIRKKLNPSSKVSLQKKEKKKFEIKSIRPCTVQGWFTNDKKKGDTQIQGVEVNLRVNEKGDIFPVPLFVCYFYDKEKNLVERKKAEFFYSEKSLDRPTELTGDLFVKGKRDTRIIFISPVNIRFKYALCVIGNNEEVDVATFPKSISSSDFEFDEKKSRYPE